MKKVSCVIMDWAGTAVDFGCFAPLNAFLKVFQEQGVTITYRQAREPMGLLKIEHIKAILKMPEVKGFVQHMDGNGIRMMSQSCIRVLRNICLLHFRILRLLFREL